MAQASSDDVLVVGTVAYDTIKTPFDEVERVLGGSACYFSSASSLFTGTHIVSAVGHDFDMDALDFLAKRGVDLTGINVHDDQETFHWSGEYHYDMNARTTLATDLNVLEAFQPTVPASARSAPVVFLANIDPELQLDVLDQVPDGRLVAADTMNFWIEGKPKELKEVLSSIDILILNDEEARELADTPSLVEAIRRIQGLGPQAVVVKKGEHGCVLANRDHWFAAPAFIHADVRDPTGAGDAFAGGFMGTLAALDGVDDMGLRKAAVYGTACASIVIEDFGPAALAKATREDVESRARELSRFAQFPEIP